MKKSRERACLACICKGEIYLRVGKKNPPKFQKKTRNRGEEEVKMQTRREVTEYNCRKMDGLWSPAQVGIDLEKFGVTCFLQRQEKKIRQAEKVKNNFEMQRKWSSVTDLVKEEGTLSEILRN